MARRTTDMPEQTRDNLHAIRRSLQGVARRRWWVRVAKSGVLVGGFAGVFCLLATFLIGSWPDQPPGALRGAAGGASALLLLLLVLNALRAIVWRPNPAQTARFVEAQLPAAQNRLINAVQLANDPDQPSVHLVDAALSETARWCGQHDLTRAVPTRALKRTLLVFAATMLLAVTSVLLVPQWTRRGLIAIFHPTRFVPRVAFIEATRIAPGDATVFLGEPVTIEVDLATPLPMDTDVSVVFPNGDPRPIHIDDTRTRLTCPLGPAVDSFSYAIRLNDTRYPLDVPYYELTVLPDVELRNLNARAVYPDYLQRGPEVFADFDGNVTAPLGTDVTLEFAIHPPVSSVVIEYPDAPPSLLSPDADGIYLAALDLASDRYRITVYDSEGRTVARFPAPPVSNPSARPSDKWFNISTIDDAPPRIAIVSPGARITAPHGQSLPIHLAAGDDHGLTRLDVFVATGDGPFSRVDTAELGNTPAAEHTYMLATDALPTDTEELVLRYYAQVADNRDLPGRAAQTVRTPEHQITVQTPESFTTDREERLTDLRQHLIALLEQQARLRVHTELCLSTHADLSQVRATGEHLASGQEHLREQMRDLVQTFPFTSETNAAQQVLNAMVGTEAGLAVAQSRALTTVPSFDARTGVARTLAETQDTILRKLQVLLGVTPPPTGGTHPDESRDPGALADEARSLLEEFATEQRRIIEASQGPGSKSNEDLTSEDQDALEDLKTAQEDLHRYLDEAQSRLDKLQEQDFSSSVELTELAEIRAEVTMASEALEQDAAEVATAHEENATENAESLTSNLEKWLPDYLDREQWQMEDAPSPTDINAAELPDTLEDMIGDLLEQEEDLFDAIDDLSSDAMAGLDKGAGWDVLDGPISNMNAQGVTGNQLPNTSDISGRSGEGRSGRSEGEMIEDEATGKGGRRTETRLTDDPYQEGHIEDTDASAPGGATGGGKVSVAGAEGLEGPPPPELQDALDAMAARQALLTQRANALRVQLDADDLSQFALTDAIVLMNRVQKDLDDYNYENALRRRDDLVRNLRNAQAGSVDLQFVQDATKSAATDDTSVYAPQSDLPDAYRDHLQEYYRRLSQPDQSR